MHIRNTDLDGLSQQHGIPWRDSDAICPADGHAMSHPVRAVNGTQERWQFSLKHREQEEIT